MKSKLLLACAALLLIVSPAFAATAYWTGKREQVRTVTGKYVWKCEYRLHNKYLIYRLFERSCPSSIEVE